MCKYSAAIWNPTAGVKVAPCTSERPVFTGLGLQHSARRVLASHDRISSSSTVYMVSTSWEDAQLGSRRTATYSGSKMRTSPSVSICSGMHRVWAKFNWLPHPSTCTNKQCAEFRNTWCTIVHIIIMIKKKTVIQATETGLLVLRVVLSTCSDVHECHHHSNLTPMTLGLASMTQWCKKQCNWPAHETWASWDRGSSCYCPGTERGAVHAPVHGTRHGKYHTAMA